MEIWLPAQRVQVAASLKSPFGTNDIFVKVLIMIVKRFIFMLLRGLTSFEMTAYRRLKGEEKWRRSRHFSSPYIAPFRCHFDRREKSLLRITFVLLVKYPVGI